jgi:hypothetical protein
MTNFVRMISAGDVTEFNVGGILYAPADDNSFAIPAEFVAEARKANLVVAELTQAQRLSRVFDAIGELDEGEAKAALVAAFAQTQLARLRAERPDLATR